MAGGLSSNISAVAAAAADRFFLRLRGMLQLDFRVTRTDEFANWFLLGNNDNNKTCLSDFSSQRRIWEKKLLAVTDD